MVENKTDATCTEDGNYDNVVYCSACNAELSRETVTVPATGHDYDDNGNCSGCNQKTIRYLYTRSEEGITLRYEFFEDFTVRAYMEGVTEDGETETFEAFAEWKMTEDGVIVIVFEGEEQERFLIGEDDKTLILIEEKYYYSEFVDGYYVTYRFLIDYTFSIVVETEEAVLQETTGTWVERDGVLHLIMENGEIVPAFTVNADGTISPIAPEPPVESDYVYLYEEKHEENGIYIRYEFYADGTMHGTIEVNDSVTTLDGTWVLDGEEILLSYAGKPVVRFVANESGMLTATKSILYFFEFEEGSVTVQFEFYMGGEMTVIERSKDSSGVQKMEGTWVEKDGKIDVTMEGETMTLFVVNADGSLSIYEGGDQPEQPVRIVYTYEFMDGNDLCIYEFYENQRIRAIVTFEDGETIEDWADWFWFDDDTIVILYEGEEVERFTVDGSGNLTPEQPEKEILYVYEVNADNYWMIYEFFNDNTVRGYFEGYDENGNLAETQEAFAEWHYEGTFIVLTVPQDPDEREVFVLTEDGYHLRPYDYEEPTDRNLLYEYNDVILDGKGSFRFYSDYSYNASVFLTDTGYSFGGNWSQLQNEDGSVIIVAQSPNGEYHFRLEGDQLILLSAPETIGPPVIDREVLYVGAGEANGVKFEVTLYSDYTYEGHRYQDGMAGMFGGAWSYGENGRIQIRMMPDTLVFEISDDKKTLTLVEVIEGTPIVPPIDTEGIYTFSGDINGKTVTITFLENGTYRATIASDGIGYMVIGSWSWEDESKIRAVVSQNTCFFRVVEGQKELLLEGVIENVPEVPETRFEGHETLNGVSYDIYLYQNGNATIFVKTATGEEFTVDGPWYDIDGACTTFGVDGPDGRYVFSVGEDGYTLSIKSIPAAKEQQYFLSGAEGEMKYSYDLYSDGTGLFVYAGPEGDGWVEGRMSFEWHEENGYIVITNEGVEMIRFLLTEDGKLVFDGEQKQPNPPADLKQLYIYELPEAGSYMLFLFYDGNVAYVYSSFVGGMAFDMLAEWDFVSDNTIALFLFGEEQMRFTIQEDGTLMPGGSAPDDGLNEARLNRYNQLNREWMVFRKETNIDAVLGADNFYYKKIVTLLECVLSAPTYEELEKLTTEFYWALEQARNEMGNTQPDTDWLEERKQDTLNELSLLWESLYARSEFTDLSLEVIYLEQYEKLRALIESATGEDELEGYYDEFIHMYNEIMFKIVESTNPAIRYIFDQDMGGTYLHYDFYENGIVYGRMWNEIEEETAWAEWRFDGELISIVFQGEVEVQLTVNEDGYTLSVVEPEQPDREIRYIFEMSIDGVNVHYEFYTDGTVYAYMWDDNGNTEEDWAEWSFDGKFVNVIYEGEIVQRFTVNEDDYTLTPEDGMPEQCPHDSVHSELMAPTCEVPGYDRGYCDACGELVWESIALPTGHSFDADGFCAACQKYESEIQEELTNLIGSTVQYMTEQWNYYAYEREAKRLENFLWYEETAFHLIENVRMATNAYEADSRRMEFDDLMRRLEEELRQLENNPPEVEISVRYEYRNDTLYVRFRGDGLAEITVTEYFEDGSSVDYFYVNPWSYGAENGTVTFSLNGNIYTFRVLEDDYSVLLESVEEDPNSGESIDELRQQALNNMQVDWNKLYSYSAFVELGLEKIYLEQYNVLYKSVDAANTADEIVAYHDQFKTMISEIMQKINENGGNVGETEDLETLRQEILAWIDNTWNNFFTYPNFEKIDAFAWYRNNYNAYRDAIAGEVDVETLKGLRDEINAIFNEIYDKLKEIESSCEHPNLYETERVESSCAQQGYVRYRCDDCGYEETVWMAMPEHVFENGACVNCGTPEVDLEARRAEANVYISTKWREIVADVRYPLLDAEKKSELSKERTRIQSTIKSAASVEELDMLLKEYEMLLEQVRALMNEVGGITCEHPNLYEAERVEASSCLEQGYVIERCDDCGWEQSYSISGNHSYQDGICVYCKAGDPSLGLTQRDELLNRLHSAWISFENDERAKMIDEATYSSLYDQFNQLLTRVSQITSVSEVATISKQVDVFECDLQDMLNKYGELLPCEHSFEQSELVQGTCTTQGYAVFSCVNCGESYQEFYGYADHELDERGCCLHCDHCAHISLMEETLVEATCTATGEARVTCEVCAMELIVKTPRIPHLPDESNTCTVCKESMKNVVYSYELWNDSGNMYQYYELYGDFSGYAYLAACQNDIWAVDDELFFTWKLEDSYAYIYVDGEEMGRFIVLEDGTVEPDMNYPETEPTPKPDVPEIDQPDAPVNPDVSLDFQGEEVVILAPQDTNTFWDLYSEDTSTVLSQAVYERNMMTEERLNVVLVFTHINVNSSEYLNHLNALSMSGMLEDSIDFVSFPANCVTNANVMGYYKNVAASEYIDIDASWWNASYNEAARQFGTQYTLFGDINASAYDFVNVVYFNRDLLENLGLEDPYQLVMEGRWTLEMMSQYSELAFTDSTYGMLGVKSRIAPIFLRGSKISLVTYNEANDRMEPQLAESAIVLMEMLQQSWNSPSAYQASTPVELYNVMAEGRALFMVETLRRGNGSMLAQISDAGVSYGVLPIPKQNEEQDDYATPMEANHPVIAVINDNLMVGAVLNTMGELSQQKVTEAYRTNLIRYAESPEAQMMLEIILDNVWFDYLGVYDIAAGNVTNRLWSQSFMQNTPFVSGFYAAQAEIAMRLEQLESAILKK